MVEKYIFIIRGQKVILSSHLAKLYGVEVRALTQALKRNMGRFPKDFMFQIDAEEYEILKSQIVISRWGGIGVAMLSSVLRSEHAIRVNIAIMRAFVKIREMLSANRELAQKLGELESKIEKHDVDIRNIFDAIRELMRVPEKPKRQIGFHASL